MGRLYEETTRIPLLVHHPDGIGAGLRIRGILQPADILPSVLDFMNVPVPQGVEGRSFLPLMRGEATDSPTYAFSNRYPQNAATVGGAAFDGWVGSGRVVEPGTITSDEWTYICMPAGLPSELYDLKADPRQNHNVIGDYPEIAERMKKAWLTFLREHGATEERISAFTQGLTDVPDITGRTVYAFRDDLGQWIAFASEEKARELAYREDAPGPERVVEAITFSDLLADNPKNLVHLYDQYYWAEDLT